MNQDKKSFRYKLISSPDQFKNSEEFFNTIETLSPYAKALLFSIYSMQAEKDKNHKMLEMCIQILIYFEKNINKTFYEDNLIKLSSLAEEWLNELASKNFIEIK